MAQYGMLIDYKWCTGCHTCEVSCQMLHSLPVGQYGIKVAELGPWEYEKGVWQYDYVPSLTDQCDLCQGRLDGGDEPLCVKQCQAQCLKVGPVENLLTEMAGKPHQILIQR